MKGMCDYIAECILAHYSPLQPMMLPCLIPGGLSICKSKLGSTNKSSKGDGVVMIFFSFARTSCRIRNTQVVRDA